MTFFGAPWYWLFGLMTFRLWFSAALPMTGDEAYFVLWGAHPAGGYYDHPPMVGWWLSALLALSRAEWVLRLPSTLLPLPLAWGAWRLARPWGAAQANLAAWLVFLQPANVWNVLITTDTPVVLFSMLSMLAYVTALRCSNRQGAAIAWQAAAGGLLGLAFLGKYFAALLGIAYAVHVICIRRDRMRVPGLLVLLAAALPAPIYNLWWNSGHCWVNLLFNFINRQTNVDLNPAGPMLYLIAVLYLATPWALWVLWRKRGALRAGCSVGGADEPAGSAVGGMRGVNAADGANGAIFWLALVPFAIFAAISPFRTVGLHWLLAFTPLLAVLVAQAVPAAEGRWLLRWSAGFAALHMLVFAAVLLAPLQIWQKTRWYGGIVLTARSEAVLAHLAPYADNYLFAMDGYSSAATLSYNAGRHFAVFGEGSTYARQDDFVTDWRAQQGRNVLILRKSAPSLDDYAPYFRQLEVRDFMVLGARYWMVLGKGFDYPAYRERTLRRIRERFYHIPRGLPVRGCDFYARYFPDAP